MTTPISRRVLFAGLVGSTIAHAGLAAPLKPMPLRPLGAPGAQVGILGIGCQYPGDPGIEQSTVDRAMGEAIDNGVTYLDTAPPYHQSEERLGRALKGRRDKFFLVSKVETNARGDVAYQVEDSLRKLQTDHLDGVLVHNISRGDRARHRRPQRSAGGSSYGG